MKSAWSDDRKVSETMAKNWGQQRKSIRDDGKGLGTTAKRQRQRIGDNGQVLGSVWRMVVGYSNVSNQDRPTTSQVCSSWRLCKIRGATTTRLEVHRHREEEAGYNNVTNQDR